MHAIKGREPIRLVIWDLDGTFWNGTLTEGGITLRSDTVALVKEFAGRGIMSSICSKNDLDAVKLVLERAGVWDYFIFPNIDWNPKGPRVAALIDAVQLRPESVLFIDDNPANLEEVRHFNPKVEIASHEVIPSLAGDSRFHGKDDRDLQRLQQYKKLEQRQRDLKTGSASVEDFLRSSAIKVTIEHDVEAHLARAVELINRTNQLNFTKLRLAEDAPTAQSELLGLIRSHEIQAGLIRVADRYGDHGLTGFYAVRSTDRRLLHYCFSCRILGMHVETWLYEKLHRPVLDVNGVVLTDPRERRKIDWIEEVSPQAVTAGALPRPFAWVAARGGCDVGALMHYFDLSTNDTSLEFNLSRNGFDARIDHSMFLHYSINSLPPEALKEAEKLGYRTEDFQTILFQPKKGRGLLLLSLWCDSIYALYKHKKFGFMVPWARPEEPDHERDVRLSDVGTLPLEGRGAWIASALACLKTDYDFIGLIDEATFKANLRMILDRTSRETQVVLLKRSEYLDDLQHHCRHTSHQACLFNSWLAEVASHYNNVSMFDIQAYVSGPEEVIDWLHYDRIVYYRLFKAIEMAVALPQRNIQQRLLRAFDRWRAP